MKKTLFFLSLVFVFMFSNAQKQETVLFACTSIENNFFDVIDFCETLSVEVIDFCETKRLIFVNLNDQFESSNEFFNSLEEVFEGTFYFKSDKNEIISYKDCQNRHWEEKKLDEQTRKERQ